MSDPGNGGGWAVAGAVFAGTWMMIVGALQALQGVIALFDDEFFLTTPRYTFAFDLTAWGWIHLVLGVGVFVVGLFVLNASPWARGVGIALAALTIVANFLWLPYYPFWSLCLIAFAAFVIWGLATAPKDYRV